MKKIVLAVAVLAGLFSAGYLPRHHAQKSLAASVSSAASQVPRVDVITPQLQSNIRSLTLPGSLQAQESTAVYARATGYVSRWLVDIGDKVKSGQLLAAGIAPGAAVKVSVRQYPGREFAGRITRSAGALDPATRTLTVEAEVANDTGELFPGAYADVTFPAPLAHAVSVIPASALIVDAQGTRVATVDASSKAHFVPVQIGRDQGQDVEIAFGLTGQEEVIAAPTGTLVEGAAVQVNPHAIAAK